MQKREVEKKLLAVMLATALAVPSCVTVPMTSQAAGTENTDLNNPRVEMNYCDTVYFGNYWQEDTNEDGKVDQTDDKQPIRWRILSRNGDDAYVIADKVLYCASYSESTEDNTWETCALREWMNDDFYNTAFSTDEKSAIIEQNLKGDIIEWISGKGDNDYRVVGGNATTDKVYLPSLSDMTNSVYGFSEDYHFSDPTRFAKSTSYADEQMGSSYHWELGTSWWLRSSDGKDSALHVTSYGNVSECSITGNIGIGVRPALHLNLSSPCVNGIERMELFLKSSEWDIVELGTYEDRPIRWRVLSVNGKDVFLLSDRILTTKRFNDTDNFNPEAEPKSVIWADSTLRAWLNGEFYSTAFTDEEQKGIIETTYEDTYDSWYEIGHGKDTKDKVTLLSVYDIVKKEYGFPSDYDYGHTSRIACDKEGYDENGLGSEWWLRTTSSENCLAKSVENIGNMHIGAYSYSRSGSGVRPALHFDLSAFPLTKIGEFSTEYDVKLVNSDTSDGSEAPVKYNVSFQTNGGTAVVSQTVSNGGKIIKPADPVKEGYTFAGWMVDGTLYDFSMVVTKDIVLVAQWKENNNPAQSVARDTTSSTDDNNKAAAPAAKGTELTTSDNKANVKVTSSDASNPTVAYVGAVNKKSSSVTIPATVTIDNVAYKVTSVGNKAFSGNKKITKVTIGKNVTSIGKNAFQNCKKLKTITIKSTSLKSVGKNALNGINKKATIKVPKKQLKAYKKLFSKKTGYKKTMKIKK